MRHRNPLRSGGGARRAAAALALGVSLATCQADELVSPDPPGTLEVSPATTRDSAAVGSRPARSQQISITSTGAGSLAWTAAKSRGSGWLTLSLASGTTPATLTLSLDPAGLFVGEYHDTVIIAPTDGATDPVRVPVRFAVQPCRERPLALGATVADSLTDADCEAPHRAGRFARLYRFDGAAGDSVKVVLRSNAFDAYVLLDSATAGAVPPVAEADRCGTDAAAACVRYALLPRAGTYYVEVTSAGTGVATGAFTLAVTPPRPPSLPTSAAQFAADSVTPLAVGTTIGDPVLVVRAVGSDPDLADSLALQVEVQPIGTPFTGTPTVTGARFANGTAGSVRLEGLADNTSLHWQVRSIDETGRAGSWVSFGGNAEGTPDVRVAIAQPPTIPTALGQFRSDGSTALASGSTTNEPTVVFKGTVGDPDPGDQVRLEVEVAPFGTPFAGVATAAGVLVANGTVASVTVTGLLDGVSYHWQVRTVDQATRASNWVAYAGAGQATPDFRVYLPATDLAFVTQPSGAVAGSVITPAVTVQARKASGVVDTTYGGTVNVVIAPRTGSDGAVLGGTLSVAAARGISTFANLSVNLAGTGYRLLATATNLNDATSGQFSISASGAARLALSTPPSDAGRSGIPLATQPAAQVQDAAGNPVAQSGVQVVATIASGPGGASLSGGTALSDASGRAAFSSLAIEGPTGNYTLRFDAAGLTGVLSGTIAVAPGNADPSRTTATVPAGTAGSPTSILVTVRDGAGNRLTVGGNAVAVTVTGANSASPAVADNGNGTYAASYTPTVAGTDAVAITLGGAAIAGSPYQSTVTAAGGARLVFLASPASAVAGANFSPPVRVAVQDANGNTDASSTAAITIAIGTNAGGGVLSGSTTVSAVSGVATFNNLSIDRVGTGYTLTASATGLTGATSPAFTVTPGTPVRAAFVTQPSNVVAGASIAPAVTVAIQDANGNVVTSSTATVEMAIGTNPPGNAVLGGQTSVASVNGVATFGGLTIARAASGYTLRASSGSLTAAASSPFNVSPGNPAALVFTEQPVIANAGVPIQPAVAVAVRDAQGNTVDTASREITLAIGTNPPPGTGVLSGTRTRRAVAGVATFDDVEIDVAANGYTLTANDGILPQAVSTSFNVSVGTGRCLVFARSPSNTIVGAAITPAVQVAVQDCSGNLLADDDTTTVNMFLGNARGAALSGTVTATAVNGIATFSTLSVNRVAAGYTLTAIATGPNPATSSAFDVTAAATTTVITSDLPDPSVTGQTVTVAYSVTVTAPGSGDPTGNVTVSDGSGVTCVAPVAAGGCALISTTAGAKTLTATYAGDGNYLASPPSAVAPHQVNQAATTTAITTHLPDPSVTGEPITVSYTVNVTSPGGGTPTGIVTVTAGTDTCTGTVAEASCQLTPTTAGAKFLTARYGGDANYLASPPSAGAPHQVNRAETTTEITSDVPDPSLVGQAVTVAVAVNPASPGAGTPTGSVTVSGGTGISCEATLAGGGGICALTFLTAGTKAITATYAGDADFARSTVTSAAEHRVDPAATATVVSSSLNPSTFGASVTFTATVTSGVGTPAGTVQFRVDGVSLGTPVTLDESGVATSPATTSLAAGTRVITAEYSGATDFAASTGTLVGGQVVNPAATTTVVSSSLNPSTFGASVTFTATVTSGVGTPTGTVQFRVDGVSLGTPVTLNESGVATSPATTSLAVGTRVVTAEYSGATDFAPSSGTLEGGQVVDPAATTTVVSSSLNPSTFGESVTFTATVTSPAGIPTGNVRFRVDGNDIPPAPFNIALVNGVATSRSYSAPAPGTYVVTAVYTSNSADFASGRDTLDGGQAVNRIPTTTAILVHTPDPSLVGEAVTVTFTVTSAGGTPTGDVTVSDGEGTECTASVAVGQCQLSFTTAGAKTLTATYAGDGSFAGSASAGEAHTVDSPE